MGFFFISPKLNMSPIKLVVASLLFVSFIILPTAALAQTAVTVSVNNTSLIVQLLALINQLLEQLKSLQAKLAAQQVSEGIFAPTPLPVPTPTPTPVPTTPMPDGRQAPAPRPVPQPEPTPAPTTPPISAPTPTNTGTLTVTALNGLARCIKAPCVVPLFGQSVTVGVYNNVGRLVSSLVTTNGTASFSGLAAGSYTIKASAAGFVTSQTTIALTQGKQVAVSLTLNP